MQIELGVQVKDQVTGLTGIAVARTCWLNGCVRITVQPKVDKEGKDVSTVCVDEFQCTVSGGGVSGALAAPVSPAAAAGARAGDRPSPTRQPDPTP